MAGQFRSRIYFVVVVCVVLLTLGISAVAAAEPAAYNGGQCSQFVSPRPGDGWNSVAQRYGVSVVALKAANAGYLRRNNQLWLTDRLCIPTGSQPAPTVGPTPEGSYYTVRRGDTWSGIAWRTGVPFAELWKANPKLQRAGKVLYVGDRMVIPGKGATTPAVTPAPGASATPAPEGGMPACPAQFADYGTALGQALNANADKVGDWLKQCGAVSNSQGELRQFDLNGDNLPDYVIAITDPTSTAAVPNGELFLYHSGRDTKELAYQAGAAGAVAILAIEDFNADGLLDVAWTDTTCGAHTCFGAVHIISWQPSASSYQNWVNGNATMAYPTIKFQDVNDGSGKELLLNGGIIASVGAGPQRSWTETWSSVSGAPYQLTDLQYDPSNCLYHHVVDANQLLADGKFAEAAIAYTALINDAGLEKCGTRDNELAELRSFARYRLALAQAYAGDLTAAETAVTEFVQTEPADLYAQVADLWWKAYAAPQDAAAACAAVTAFATANPDTWQILFDFGYANPTFSAAEVCVVPAP